MICFFTECRTNSYSRKNCNIILSWREKFFPKFLHRVFKTIGIDHIQLLFLSPKFSHKPSWETANVDMWTIWCQEDSPVTPELSAAKHGVSWDVRAHAAAFLHYFVLFPKGGTHLETKHQCAPILHFLHLLLFCSVSRIQTQAAICLWNLFTENYIHWTFLETSPVIFLNILFFVFAASASFFRF